MQHSQNIFIFLELGSIVKEEKKGIERKEVTIDIVGNLVQARAKVFLFKFLKIVVRLFYFHLMTNSTFFERIYFR